MYAVAILQRLLPKNYVCIVAFTFDLGQQGNDYI